ncbi:hypothetical protein B0T25DRAFT_553859 [Lasiosphaeria hispida]|uniref:Uncharacterized protein n=1 Tax=Lasiosphaeria hispida TaxID=260671 RepID=A0AAJ0MBH7_9PEZI|nr:hypothetical protein B0T25DRAFT_553859 [Lasiosphaeria hispida]
MSNQNGDNQPPPAYEGPQPGSDFASTPEKDLKPEKQPNPPTKKQFSVWQWICRPFKGRRKHRDCQPVVELPKQPSEQQSAQPSKQPSKKPPKQKWRAPESTIQLGVRPYYKQYFQSYHCPAANQSSFQDAMASPWIVTVQFGFADLGTGMAGSIPWKENLKHCWLDQILPSQSNPFGGQKRAHLRRIVLAPAATKVNGKGAYAVGVRVHSQDTKWLAALTYDDIVGFVNLDSAIYLRAFTMNDDELGAAFYFNFPTLKAKGAFSRVLKINEDQQQVRTWGIANPHTYFTKLGRTEPVAGQVKVIEQHWERHLR